ncbi:hypothetical protein FKM82_030610, partial [Ascaphus truei]
HSGRRTPGTQAAGHWVIRQQAPGTQTAGTGHSDSGDRALRQRGPGTQTAGTGHSDSGDRALRPPDPGQLKGTDTKNRHTGGCSVPSFYRVSRNFKAIKQRADGNPTTECLLALIPSSSIELPAHVHTHYTHTRHTHLLHILKVTLLSYLILITRSIYFDPKYTSGTSKVWHLKLTGNIVSHL